MMILNKKKQSKKEKLKVEEILDYNSENYEISIINFEKIIRRQIKNDYYDINLVYINIFSELKKYKFDVKEYSINEIYKSADIDYKFLIVNIMCDNKNIGYLVDPNFYLLYRKNNEYGISSNKLDSSISGLRLLNELNISRYVKVTDENFEFFELYLSVFDNNQLDNNKRKVHTNNY